MTLQLNLRGLLLRGREGGTNERRERERREGERRVRAGIEPLAAAVSRRRLHKP